MSDSRNNVNSIVAWCVIGLCLLTCALILLLPAESLVVDLVYQGF